MLLAMLPALPLAGANLLANPAFEDGLAGWDSLWTREPNAGVARLVDSPSGRAVEVRHDGTQDWSFAQSRRATVSPGQVYTVSAYLKAVDSQGAEVSVVARTSADDVLDWSYAPIRSGGTHDWKRLTRRFVVPKRCASVQFRLIGYGKGTVLMRRPELALVASHVPASLAKPLSIANAAMSLSMDGDGAMSLTDRRNGRSWRTEPFGPDYMVESLKKTDGTHLKATVRWLAQDAPLNLSIALDPKASEASFALEGTADMPDDLPLPGAVRTAKGQWLIVPMNEGILYPTDDATIPPTRLIAYGGHGLCMPWFGVEDPKTGAGVMTRFATPDDADMSIDRTDGLLRVQPRWEPSRGVLRYPRKLTLTLIDKGGYVAMAKRYRAVAKREGLFRTLADKRKANPYVDRLVGAMNVWNWDMDVVSLCKELKAGGADRVLWSRGGSAGEMAAVNALGFLSSRYDIYQDVWDPGTKLSWMNSEGWPQDLVSLPNGDWMKGWAHPDHRPDGTTKWYQGGVICSERGLARAKKAIPEELRAIPYHCRFIDTTTASPFRECYNPAHPLSRSDDRRYKMDLLKLMTDQGLVCGSETGIDPSVPYASYYEGMMSLGPYRLPDSGTDMIAYRKPTPDFLKFQVGSYYRLPLWELVYHDCTVAQWYWGDATNKAPEVWGRRDLLNILYGTAPLVMFDKAKWTAEKPRILQTYRDVCRWVRKIGYDEMLSHEYLTGDHTVQRTRWSGGRSVTVNFGQTPYHGIGPMSWKIASDVRSVSPSR